MVKEKDGGVEKLDHENALKPRMENQKHREAQKLTPILPECFADFWVSTRSKHGLSKHGFTYLKAKYAI